MIVHISAGAKDDISDGFWFYERQRPGLGGYFLSCILADIESLAYFAGVHEIEHGLHRSLTEAISVRYLLFSRRSRSN